MIGKKESRSSPELILNEIACPNTLRVTSNRQSLQSGLSKRVKRFFKLSFQVLRFFVLFGPYLQQVSAKLVKSAALKIWNFYKCVNCVPLRSLDGQMTFPNIGPKTLKKHLSSTSRGGQGFCSRSLMAWRWRGVQSLEMHQWCLVKIFWTHVVATVNRIIPLFAQPWFRRFLPTLLRQGGNNQVDVVLRLNCIIKTLCCWFKLTKMTKRHKWKKDIKEHLAKIKEGGQVRWKVPLQEMANSLQVKENMASNFREIKSDETWFL